MNRPLRTFLLSVPCALVLAMAPTAAHASVITFDETIGADTTFDGLFGQTLVSADGEYLVESFWLNSGGHFHVGACGFDGNCESNHNQSGGSSVGSELQGIRISRIDNAAFSLVSMNLFSGQASIGDLTNFTTGAGTWTLFNSPGGAPILFGAQFANVNEIFLADPFAAGGSTFGNLWDNITLEAAAVPEPSMLLLMLGSFGALQAHRRARRQ